jgi:FlaG/FlaF family flagellin (archaellin)
VIGVILMVAITVILAAVIGAFVLEIGDQQETAPSTSFNTAQGTQFYSDGGDSSNLTRVRIAHAGGTTLSVRQNDIKVEGNGSVWAVRTRISGSTDSAEPQPDHLATLGSNDQVSFTAGQTWDVVAYNNDAAVSDANLDASIDYRFDYTINGEGVFLNEDTSSGGSNSAGWGSNQLSTLDDGDAVRVVWTASSGGKTQTLQRYSVQ